ncbi:AAA family ATPase [Clostridium sp. DL-VIII]|uniref:AAA family ATPase n=1 Tax=Clostridium sp. DL-VIII TaxID=641107 RepID=UPI0002E83DA2|nr:AAA family ATPase [Clostridium sp. DL-VIII]
MKLKSIDIEAFRAYKDPESFNFLSRNGDIADLVVIYAPNGFGKTSFFDAVEWSFTDEIRRISGNIEVKKIANFEKENILKNMYSDKTFGTIRIITDENKILEINTLEIKGKRLTDYKPGEIVRDEIRTNEIFKTFHSRNIITSDKIDEFLRFQKPVERYKVLEDFWDDNKESIIYFNINSMYSEANKLYKEITNVITNNKEDVNKLAFVTKKIDDINNLMDIYNDLTNEHQKHMEYDIESSEINECLNYFTNKKLQIEREENLSDKNKNELDELVVKYEKYKLEKEEIILLNKKINEKKIIVRKFDNIEESIKKLNIGNKRLEQIGFRIKNLSILKDSTGFYIEETSKLTNGNKEISELLEKKIHIAEETNKIQKEIEKLNRKIEKNNSTKFDIAKTIDKINENIDIYFKCVNKTPKVNRIISKLNAVIDLRQKRIDKYLSRKSELINYLQYNNEILFSNDLKSAKFNRCKELYINIKEVQKKIQDVNIKYKKFVALDDKVNEIISAGRILIKENKLTKCPLCNRDYKKFETLLENLDSNLEDSFGIKEIEEELVKTMS